MRFADLISKVPSVQREGSADAEVTAIADDSRKVGPGTLFVARGGARADGGAFVADAIKRGAVAIVAAPGVAVPANMPVARAVHPSLSAAHLAHAFHGFPQGPHGRPLRCFRSVTIRPVSLFLRHRIALRVLRTVHLFVPCCHPLSLLCCW